MSVQAGLPAVGVEQGPDLGLRSRTSLPTAGAPLLMGGSIINQRMLLCAQILGTTDEKPGTVYAELDYAEVETRRLNMPVMQQKRHDLYALIDKT